MGNWLPASRKCHQRNGAGDDDRNHYGATTPRQDIEQVVPLGPVDEDHFCTVAHSFLAKGYTPIAESLRQAAASLPVGARERNTIVLLSDGEEACGGDPCALSASDVGVIVYAVGFAADEATRMQLQCIADVSGGSYRDAENTLQLRFALEIIRLSLAARQHPLDILMQWLPLIGGTILLTIDTRVTEATPKAPLDVIR